MASSTSVKVLTDVSQHLNLLSEFFKNPKLVDQLAEEVRKLNALTEEEEKRAHEGRLAIQQCELARKETQRLKDSHETLEKEHQGRLDAQKAEFDAYLKEKNEALEAREAAVQKREDGATEYGLKLDQRANALKEKAAKISGILGDNA